METLKDKLDLLKDSDNISNEELESSELALTDLNKKMQLEFDTSIGIFSTLKENYITYLGIDKSFTNFRESRERLKEVCASYLVVQCAEKLVIQADKKLLKLWKIKENRKISSKINVRRFIVLDAVYD